MNLINYRDPISEGSHAECECIERYCGHPLYGCAAEAIIVLNGALHFCPKCAVRMLTKERSLLREADNRNLVEEMHFKDSQISFLKETIRRMEHDRKVLLQRILELQGDAEGERA